MNKVILSYETLYKEYIENLKPMWQISKENNISVGTIFNLLKKYKIPSRKAMNELTKAKISKSMIGHVSPNKGKKLSEETKKKISIANKGKYRINTRFGGHKKKRKDGYIYVYNPLHPNSTKDGYIMEHHLIMEAKVGRILLPDEVVHHKNHIRDDNSIENLQLMTFKEHARMHMLERNEKRRKNKND